MTDDMADVVEQLGRRVASKRVEMGITQNDLARRVPCSAGTIRRLESGKSRGGPSVTVLVAVARALCVNTSFLLGETTFDEPFLPELRGGHFVRR
jgi:transcriptional regulator with XRE-family HTH domain